MPKPRFVDLDQARRRRELLLTIVWTIASAVAVLATYYLIGFAGQSLWTVVGALAVGGALLGISLTRQFRKILTDDLPGLRAFRALATITVVFLTVFAGAYLSFPTGSFSVALSHTSALYFAITVLSTVGFGDITPQSDPARIVVALQMLLGLVLLGAVVRAFVAAARTRAPIDDAGERSDTEPG